jgi:hypothetical protein
MLQIIRLHEINRGKNNGNNIHYDIINDEYTINEIIADNILITSIK